ncbi:unnamed protein product [Protopolystoma xenopodis]|uniref:Ubiquitin-like domain-containing protein n=1 Tax=Protopolystoma xenopodis TaxID=117903 RepID=A0A3S5BP43_9PLAT|nr:unnamed protein product [Protopolystoma xenopodis]
MSTRSFPVSSSSCVQPLAMHLIVRSYDTHLVDTSQYQSVSDLKILLADKDNLPLDSIQLYHGTKLLDSCCGLDTLSPSSTIDVVVPLLGGKVHGSLARAGKVRNQTPKVEKQEKKKKPRGRAKRRMQYTSRFVAVVAVPMGRRRGPNSNMKT